MSELSTYSFVVLFVAGVIYSFGRSALTLGLKEEAPEIWHALGEPLGPRDYNAKFLSWLLLRQYRAEAVPAYLQTYLSWLRIAQIVMLAAMSAFVFAFIGYIFEPRIESHPGPSYPISGSEVRP